MKNAINMKQIATINYELYFIYKCARNPNTFILPNPYPCLGLNQPQKYRLFTW